MPKSTTPDAVLKDGNLIALRNIEKGETLIIFLEDAIATCWGGSELLKLMIRGMMCQNTQ